MRYIVVIASVLLFFSCSQGAPGNVDKRNSADTIVIHDTVIKIQADTTPIATFRGYYDEVITMNELLRTDKIKVSGSENRICSFRVTMFIHGVQISVSCPGDSISKKAKELLRQGVPGWEIYFNQIKALGKKGDSLFLNPIVIKIKYS